MARFKEDSKMKKIIERIEKNIKEIAFIAFIVAFVFFFIIIIILIFIAILPPHKIKSHDIFYSIVDGQFLASLILFITLIAVLYYAEETRKLRKSQEKGQRPFIIPLNIKEKTNLEKGKYPLLIRNSGILVACNGEVFFVKGENKRFKKWTEGKNSSWIKYKEHLREYFSHIEIKEIVDFIEKFLDNKISFEKFILGSRDSINIWIQERVGPVGIISDKNDKDNILIDFLEQPHFRYRIIIEYNDKNYSEEWEHNTDFKHNFRLISKKKIQKK